jgi:hypothetical protein
MPGLDIPELIIFLGIIAALDDPVRDLTEQAQRKIGRRGQLVARHSVLGPSISRTQTMFDQPPALEFPSA